MGTSVLPDWRPQQTLIDLYNEKDQTPGHCKVGATLSVLMLAVGYLRQILAYHNVMLTAT